MAEQQFDDPMGGARGFDFDYCDDGTGGFDPFFDALEPVGTATPGMVPGVGLGDREDSDGSYLGRIDEWGKSEREIADQRAAREAGETRASSASASERCAELFAQMKRQRHVLRGILDACDPARPLDEVRAQVAGLQERYRSIYTLENLLDLLEGAGAVERVTEDGAPWSWNEEDAEPVVVVIDGVEYLENPEPPAVLWRATEAGKEAAARGGALAEVEALFEREAVYLPIYKRVLTLCADGGSSMPALGAAVDNDPLVQKPRFYAARFVNNLEAVDAVVWDGAWVATETGREALQMLADVHDETTED